MKFILVTGGVISGLGKGITASSIGLLLKFLNVPVTAIKIDPYLNVDSGTMSPYEHGECYVLSDGGEADLDLGNYERFLGLQLSSLHNITTGKVYKNVIEAERAGKYLGKTVQIIPHITDEIIRWIEQVSQKPVKCDGVEIVPEVCIIELGGTVGDMENAPFIEALRQMTVDDAHQFCIAHVSLIIESGGDQKTKPTQDSIKRLRQSGLSPDFLVLRTKKLLDDSLLEKIQFSCGIKKSQIICNTDVPNIYHVPDLFIQQGLDIGVVDHLDISPHYPNARSIEVFDRYYDILGHPTKEYPRVVVGIAGKYVGVQDTYLSLIRAIEHASFQVGCIVDIKFINVSHVGTDIDTIINEINQCDKIIIPGGFGSRGVVGKLAVCKYCRENNIPLLGICLGFQVMVVEYARSLGINAVSSEWDDIKTLPNGGEVVKIIDLQAEQDLSQLGGTMRTGNMTIKLTDPTVQEWYCGDIKGEDETIVERRRHRYELSLECAEKYFSNEKCENFHIAAIADTNVEMIRFSNHKFMVGCQFHPEFRTGFDNPHPLFVQLLKS